MSAAPPRLPQTVITFTNNSSKTLNLSSSTLTAGKWTTPPPNAIDPKGSLKAFADPDEGQGVEGIVVYVVQTGSGNITTIFKAPTQGDNSVKSSSANPAIVVKDDFNPQGPLNATVTYADKA